MCHLKVIQVYMRYASVIFRKLYISCYELTWVDFKPYLPSPSFGDNLAIEQKQQDTPSVINLPTVSVSVGISLDLRSYVLVTVMLSQENDNFNIFPMGEIIQG